MATWAEEVVTKCRKAFNSGRTKSLEFRENQLRNLLRFYEENTPAILKALETDLHKSKQEATLTEISVNVMDIRNILENLKKWTAPEKPPKQFANVMDEVMIYSDPFGVVLIIGAWNYPVQVSLLPVASAIAAGNCVILKPSELAPATAQLIAELIPKYLDSECYQVVQGGPSETVQLLEQRFDYIFFTGSSKIGKLVHAAASKYLTPTTLELGGKSPCILDETANVEIAARRILWGKCLNAGQTCIAPDYLMCKREVGQKFISSAQNVLREWYGENPQKSPDFGRIINDNHFQRLSALLQSGKMAVGGQTNQEKRYIQVTILDDVKPSDVVMQEEIFGPILPIVYVDSVEEAVEYVNSNEKPLALYLFADNKNIINYVLNNTSSGGVSVNDTVMHAGIGNLPFGGVGGSGMGSYHGKYGFDTFVHKKAILVKNLSPIGEKLSAARYPPYSDSKLKLVLTLIGAKLPFSSKFLPYSIVFAFGLMSAVGLRFLETYSQKRSN